MASPRSAGPQLTAGNVRSATRINAYYGCVKRGMASARTTAIELASYNVSVVEKEKSHIEVRMNMEDNFARKFVRLH